MWYIWLILAILFSVGEILYSGFFLLWFAVGSLSALILSFFISQFFLQLIVFFAVSLLLVLILTKKLTKYFSKNDNFVTNVDKLIGETGLVIETIGSSPLETGLVKIDGETWTAVSNHGQVIEKGTLVEIEAIKGVRVVVYEA